MKILVFLQQSQGKLTKAALVATTAATELNKVWNKAGLIGVTLGAGASSAADTALEYGFEQVLFSEDGAFQNYLAQGYSLALKAALTQSGADTLVATATSVAKDFAPRLAGLLDAAQASDIIAVNGDGSLKRPMYAGNAIADVELTTATRVVTVRQTGFAAATPSGKKGTKAALTLPGGLLDGSAEFVSYETSKSDRPELTDAEIVVSGGRALKSSENFTQYIAPLADALGAAIGASRAAVDSGYAPNDWQVGQTGKVVAPNLYVAVGISGAIQHLAGMKDSKTIVALNKDPDAPIFEVASYGLVCDLFEAVPQLTEEIKKAKGS